MLQLPRCDHGPLSPWALPQCLGFQRDPDKPRPGEVAALLACLKVLELHRGWGEKSLHLPRPQCPQLFAHGLRESEKLAPESMAVPSSVTWRSSGWRAHVLHGPPSAPTASLQAFPTTSLALTLSLWPGAGGRGQWPETGVIL